jgi:hypothetical protein
MVFKDDVLELERIRYIDDILNESERFKERIKLSYAEGEVQISS